MQSTLGRISTPDSLLFIPFHFSMSFYSDFVFLHNGILERAVFLNNMRAREYHRISLNRCVRTRAHCDEYRILEAVCAHSHRFVCAVYEWWQRIGRRLSVFV